ncbi:MAG: hypothetical protein R6U68_14620 [Desulfobacteraceae bacterium]
MEENAIRQQRLENGEFLEIFDLSRRISDDAFIVRMKAEINIQIKGDMFLREELNGISIQDIIDKLGPTVAYVYEAERNFIMEQDREAVFQSLVDTFFDNIVPYLSKPVFPKKMILKKFSD